MKTQIDIFKVAGIIVRNRKTLIVRAAKDTSYMTPGGKPEAQETELETLSREMNEELSIEVATGSAEKIGTYVSEAFNNPGKMVRIDAYLVHNYDGEPKATAEIAEIRWVNSQEAQGIELAYIFKHEIIPTLVAQGLID